MELYNFEKLDVYKKSLDFIDFVYSIIELFPQEEKYNLSSQLRRATTSIALNIAEGAGENKKVFNRYVRISQGSARECLVCFEIALKREYISDEKYLIARKDIGDITKMLVGLSKYLLNSNN
ncbi:MAG: four helix bundle protein [Bacteroidales bacterium]|nr:four helix bundle protein [Bacteroidales bacterium]